MCPRIGLTHFWKTSNGFGVSYPIPSIKQRNLDEMMKKSQVDDQNYWTNFSTFQLYKTKLTVSTIGNSLSNCYDMKSQLVNAFPSKV